MYFISVITLQVASIRYNIDGHSRVILYTKK